MAHMHVHLTTLYRTLFFTAICTTGTALHAMDNPSKTPIAAPEPLRMTREITLTVQDDHPEETSFSCSPTSLIALAASFIPNTAPDNSQQTHPTAPYFKEKKD